MNKEQLVELLKEVAKNDLSDGMDIFDHPCTVAIRAINQSFDDIECLKRVALDKSNAKSKKVMMLLKLNYNPNY